VVAAAPVLRDEVRDDRVVPGLSRDLDPLHEQTEGPPGDALDLPPHAGDQAENGPASDETDCGFLHCWFPLVRELLEHAAQWVRPAPRGTGSRISAAGKGEAPAEPPITKTARREPRPPKSTSRRVCRWSRVSGDCTGRAAGTATTTGVYSSRCGSEEIIPG